MSTWLQDNSCLKRLQNYRYRNFQKQQGLSSKRYLNDFAINYNKLQESLDTGIIWSVRWWKDSISKQFLDCWSFGSLQSFFITNPIQQSNRINHFTQMSEYHMCCSKNLKIAQCLQNSNTLDDGRGQELHSHTQRSWNGFLIWLWKSLLVLQASTIKRQITEQNV